MEKTKEENFSQPEKEDKVLDYAFKFALRSTVFAALFGVALTVYIFIVNK